MDIILAGNNYEYKPQFSRLDANFGSVLLGDGAMNFEWQNYSESGFFVRDEVKHLDIFSDKDGNEYIFTAINDQKPRVFEISK